MNIYKIILFLSLIIVNFNLYGQDDSTEIGCCGDLSKMYFVFAEEMPSFPGGFDELEKFISNSIIYPEEAKNKLLVDTVYVNFCIYKNGAIKEAKVLKGKYEILNNEALRLLKIMPNWEPAKNGGKPFCFSYILPIKFVLYKQEPKLKQKNIK